MLSLYEVQLLFSHRCAVKLNNLFITDLACSYYHVKCKDDTDGQVLYDNGD